MLNKKSKKTTLSDKISDILKAPDLHDPEDDIYEETKAKTVEVDSDFDNDDGLDTVLSNFRKQNAKLLQDIDKKYSGKAVSRKSLCLHDESNDSEEIDDDEFEKDDTDKLFEKTRTTLESDSESSVISQNEADFSDEYSDNDDEEISDKNSDTQQNQGESENDDLESDFDDGDVGIADFGNENDQAGEEESTSFKHVIGANASEAVQKGNAVRQQLHVWEKLMEMRIHTQKVLISANKLPRYDEFNEFMQDSNTEFSNKVKESKKLLSNLLNKFLDVQQLLLKKYPETKNLNKTDCHKKAEEMDEEIPSDTEDEEEQKSDEETDIPTKKRKISELPKILHDQHNSYKEYRNNVIQKWHDKVRVSSGVINNKNLGANSLMNHIEHILADKERLRKRTQLKRSKYDILTLKKTDLAKTSQNDGKNGEIQQNQADDEYSSEIFDDDDFYHQLLRELIEYKTANVSDPVQLSKQWIELQQLRNKMKRKIDTKATKGRRIRYTVHPKLVNFMAPEENNTWTEEAKDELFSSIFGGKTKT